MEGGVFVHASFWYAWPSIACSDVVVDSAAYTGCHSAIMSNSSSEMHCILPYLLAYIGWQFFDYVLDISSD